MCGIAGLFDIKGSRPYDPALLERMTSAIAHRGPDGSGLHFEPGLGLGHRRLAIIDLAGGAQPMRTCDGALTVVFNGEIYNFAALRAELEATGARFDTRSDTEVLLHGWRAWRSGLFPRLQGMFAFALWDAAERTLVLARDPFGKKPLHYALLDDGTLAFGSEIKALWRLPGLDRELDSQAIEDFFTYGYVPDPKTIYRAIRKLPPAHYLIARRGRPLDIRRYWSLLDTLDQPSLSTEEALVERLAMAVKSRLVSDVPLGALLSGGVDSSAVVALMALQSDDPVRTFSIAFGDRAYDESVYARAVADRYATDHDVREVSPEDFSLIRRLPEIYDEPFGDVSAIPTFAVCAQARRFVTVALSGDGGDEALAGYRRYAFHAAAEKVRGRLPAGLRRHVFGPLADIYPRASWLPRALRARTTLKELSLDSASAYVRICSALDAETRRALLTPDFRRSLGGYDSGDVVRVPFDVDAPLDPLQRAQYADCVTYLPGDILAKIDRASMANSLELRSPMLDAAFFAASFGLSPELKLSRAAGGKAILKQAMEKYLPRDLLYRRKQGFTVPLASWFRGPLRAEMLGLADNPNLRASGVVDTAEIRRLAQAHASGLADHSKSLWLAWVFNAFLDHGQAAAAQNWRIASTARPQPTAARMAQTSRLSRIESG
jgi:asparagine synthase (glutamine-hydrolysing)